MKEMKTTDGSRRDLLKGLLVGLGAAATAAATPAVAKSIVAEPVVLEGGKPIKTLEHALNEQGFYKQPDGRYANIQLQSGEEWIEVRQMMVPDSSVYYNVDYRLRVAGQPLNFRHYISAPSEEILAKDIGSFVAYCRRTAIETFNYCVAEDHKDNQTRIRDAIVKKAKARFLKFGFNGDMVREDGEGEEWLDFGWSEQGFLSVEYCYVRHTDSILDLDDYSDKEPLVFPASDDVTREWLSRCSKSRRYVLNQQTPEDILEDAGFEQDWRRRVFSKKLKFFSAVVFTQRGEMGFGLRFIDHNAPFVEHDHRTKNFKDKEDVRKNLLSWLEEGIRDHEKKHNGAASEKIMATLGDPIITDLRDFDPKNCYLKVTDDDVWG